MQLSYHELVGREVLGADGRRLGRVADLEADRQGEALCVVALLVGRAALFDRVWSARLGPLRLTPSRVPWSDVARVGRQVRLRVDRLEPGAQRDLARQERS